ncbi:hypothetical protein OSL58_23415, partial [Escherichia coli]|nr:hypothetical protein [Escherichia coli]
FCSLLAPSDAILFQEGVSVKLRLPHTFFSVPNVRINIREYHDIPAETPYAPGEQIKGGQ